MGSASGQVGSYLYIGVAVVLVVVLAVTFASYSGTLKTNANNQTSTILHFNSTSTPLPVNGTSTILPISNETYPIKIISIEAANTQIGSMLSFNVTLMNVGTIPIQYTSGCLSGIRFTVSPAYLVRNESIVGCDALESLTLNPSAHVIIHASPDNFKTYVISAAGDATVNFTFFWASGTAESSANSIAFSAKVQFR